MARVVILHGRVGADEYFSDRYPSASNSHWIPWLQKQLLIKGHDVQTPEVVRPYLADYDGWRTEFERHLDDEPMGNSTCSTLLTTGSRSAGLSASFWTCIPALSNTHTTTWDISV